MDHCASSALAVLFGAEGQAVLQLKINLVVLKSSGFSLNNLIFSIVGLITCCFYFLGFLGLMFSRLLLAASSKSMTQIPG